MRFPLLSHIFLAVRNPCDDGRGFRTTDVTVGGGYLEEWKNKVDCERSCADESSNSPGGHHIQQSRSRAMTSQIAESSFVNKQVIEGRISYKTNGSDY